MDLHFGVSEFVALVNQTLEYAYNSVIISGELANFKVSKNQWVHFDLKDDHASVHFFGTIYQLSGPLEDGMMLEVRGNPRLSPRYGFSLTIQTIRPVGEGTIKRASDLLEAKLEKEGLFAPDRKRELVYPPSRIGLIASSESAAYRDFIKILDSRWGGIDVVLADVQVQGEASPEQIVKAINDFNQLAEPPEILVITRGGGSADDLVAFSDERVVRAVSASRIPTLVAIGHEVDTSLAELAADQRASTPSNAAELLVPDKRDVLNQLTVRSTQLRRDIEQLIDTFHIDNQSTRNSLDQLIDYHVSRTLDRVDSRRQLLRALDPKLPLERGYALVRNANNELIRNRQDISENDIIAVEISDAILRSKVEQIDAKK